MAFVTLVPPADRKELSVGEIVRRLRVEVSLVDVDPQAGQDHVAGMIAAVLGFSDELPGKAERLAWLQASQADAIYLSFGDEDGHDVARCCLIEGGSLFFDDLNEIEGPARVFVERAGRALGYELVDG